MKSWLLGLVVVCGLLAGCAGGGGGGRRTFDPAIKIINSVSDSTTLITRVNETDLGSPLAYLGNTPDFVSVKPDDYDLGVRQAGESVDLDTLGFVTETNRNYLVVHLGIVNFGEEFAKRARPFVYQLDRSFVNGSKARLYVVNTLVSETGFTLPVLDVQDGERPRFRFPDLAYGAIQNQLVDAGEIAFEARLNDSELIYTTGNLNLAAGRIYVAVITGVINSTGAKEPRFQLYEISVRDDPV